MEAFYLLCLIPIGITIFAKVYFKYTISWLEAGVQLVASVVILSIVYFSGAYSALGDTQIINGHITEKVRDHGTYLQPYSCRCRTIRIGKSSTTHCATCYTRHYTVDWYLRSTIGNIQISSKDWTNSAVYLLPDPLVYKTAFIGEPCAKEQYYVNYIKGAPDSIFHAVGSATTSFIIPKYPEVYSYYKVRHVQSIGIKRDETLEIMDKQLAAALKTLGPIKQANINVVIVKTPNTLYRYALERKWLGGKKNDITVVIGAPQYPKISWVQAFTFGNSAGNNMLTVSLRDNLLKSGVIDHNTASIIVSNTSAYYKRKSMKEFEYLKDDIDPPTWVLVLSVLVSLGVGFGLTYYFHNNEDF